MKVYVGRILELFLKDLGLVERGSIWEVGSVYYLCVEQELSLSRDCLLLVLLFVVEILVFSVLWLLSKKGILCMCYCLMNKMNYDLNEYIYIFGGVVVGR